MIITMAMIVMGVDDTMPLKYSEPPVNNEAQLGLIVANLFREAGWKVLELPPQPDGAPDFIVSKQGKKLVVEMKRAAEGRKDRVIPLLSQAVLEAVHHSRSLAGHPIPVAIVGANRIPDSVANEAIQFARQRVPEAAVGLLDFEGLRSFAGHGLELLSSPRSFDDRIRPFKVSARTPQLFSDLNQWMLKILLAPRIPDGYLSAPRRHYQGASQLAEAADVSVMSAFRFVEEFSKEGFLEVRASSLRVVRVRELMNRWLGANQRRVLEIPMRWVLHRGKKALSNALRSVQSPATIPVDPLVSPQPRFCLGLFKAAEALGIGFVHGAKPYLYIERLSADFLRDLGLSENVKEEQVDVYVRIPRSRESVFRGAVRKGGVPVSDVLQVWLDVGHHPARGKEQADLIWRRILSPAFELSEQ